MVSDSSKFRPHEEKMENKNLVRKFNIALMAVLFIALVCFAFVAGEFVVLDEILEGNLIDKSVVAEAADGFVQNTDGTVITHGEITGYSTSAITTGAAATLKAYSKAYGMGSTTRIAHATVDRTVRVEITDTAVINAAQSGRLKAKVLLSGTNSFTLTHGTQNIYKRVTYTLGGGIAESSKQYTVDGNFTDESVSEGFLSLTPTSGSLTIEIRSVAVHHAETPGGGIEEVVAETSLECLLQSIKVLFLFDDVEVTLDIEGPGQVSVKKGSVTQTYSTDQQLSFTFGDVVELTAIPQNNMSYFNGWLENNVSVKTLKINMLAPSSIPSTTDYVYKATFSNFTVSTNLENFNYDGEPRGPGVSTAALEQFSNYSHEYTGQNAEGEPYSNPTVRPRNAGTYQYKFEVYFKLQNGLSGDKIGTFTKSFTIRKHIPLLTPNLGQQPYRLNFGDALADLTFSVTAKHAVTGTSVTGTWALIAEPGKELVGDQMVITSATAAAAAPRDLTKLLNVSEAGKDLYYRFIPSAEYSLNYAVAWNKVTIMVQDKMVDSSINVDGTLRKLEITKSIVTTIDSSVLNNNPGTIEKETIKVSLRVTIQPTNPPRFFFLGLRYGAKNSEGGFNYNYLTSGGTGFDSDNGGKQFDYYLPEWTANSKETRDLITTGSFQAVFLEDLSATNLETGVKENRFTGASVVFNPIFNPGDNAFYRFDWNQIEYYVNDAWQAQAPRDIGSYALRYNIRNADDSLGGPFVVGTSDLTLTITPTNVATTRLEYGNYNASTNWGDALKYRLTSVGTIKDTVEKYYYSTNFHLENDPADVIWHEINETVSQTAGCIINYTLALPEVEPDNTGGSSVATYTFMAVGLGGENMTYGGNTPSGAITYKRVGISSAVTCKIDTFVPSITSVEQGTYSGSTWTPYNGDPINKNVYFRVYTNYGGSGATIQILNAGKTLLKGYNLPGLNVGNNPTIIRSTDGGYIATEVMVDVEVSQNLYVQITNGVGKKAIYKVDSVDKALPTYIDKTPPEISITYTTENQNQYGWQNTAVTFLCAVKDKVGAGAIANPSGILSSGFTWNGKYTVNLTELSYSEWNCEGTVDDNNTYTLTVVDKAGNSRTKSFTYNIDITPVEIDIDETGYISNVWATGEQIIKAFASTGPSGMKFEYKIGSGAYQRWNENIEFDSGIFDVDSSKYIANASLYISPLENGRNDNFTLKVSNRAGSFIEIPYVVKIDITKPTIEVVTDLTPYQGSAWTDSAVTVQFKSYDTSHPTFNSGINTVIVNDGAQNITLVASGGIYQHEITKCTNHTIIVTDNAGNEETYSFSIKVDLGTPDIALQMYFGGANPNDATELPGPGDNDSSKIYDYSNQHMYVTEEDTEPWIRVEFTIIATASGTVLQQSKDKTTWTNMSVNLVPANLATEGEFKVRLFYQTEQYQKYYYRLVTGGSRYTYLTASGAVDDGVPLPYDIRIDLNAPVLTQRFIVNRVETDLINTWARENATWRFKFSDPNGSGVKQTSIKVYSYPYTKSDIEIESELKGDPASITGELKTLPPAVAGEYIIELTTHGLKYGVYCEDNAGHKAVSSIFPKLDFTSNVSISSITPTVTKLNNDPSELEYSESLWLPADEMVTFDIVIAFSGGTSFGPSGGSVEMSFDGGATWGSELSIEGVSQALSQVSGLMYSVSMKEAQYKCYKFRVKTGAGFTSIYKLDGIVDALYWVKKDSVNPTIGLAATYTQGLVINQPYTGAWIDGVINVNIAGILGPSLGTVYYATEPLAGGALSEWEFVKDFVREDVTYDTENKNYKYSTSMEFRLTTNKKYHFKVVSNRVVGNNQVEGTTSPIDIKNDNAPISLTAIGNKATSGTEVGNNVWSDENIKVKANISSKGPSPITAVSISTYSGSEWGSYINIGDNESAFYLFAHETYATSQFRIKVQNATGKEAISGVYVANIDKVTPEFTLNINTIPLSSGIYAGWYTQNVNINMLVTPHPNYGTDGLVARYYYRIHDSGDTWSSAVDLSSYNFVLKADNVVGGLDYDYKFTVKGRSGKEATFVTHYIPIDTTNYTYSVEAYVGNVEDPMPNETYLFLSSTTGTDYTYLRGSQPIIGVTAASSYKIKSIQEIVGENVSYRVEPQGLVDAYTEYGTVMPATGVNHVVWKVQLYKEVEIVYDGLMQYTQLGPIRAIGFTPSDTYFNSVFGMLSSDVALSDSQIGLDVKYTINGEETVSLPTNLGVYPVSIKFRDSSLDLVVKNDSVNMTIVYFEGAGTKESPYKVYRQRDFENISTYMHYESSYVTLDPYEFLGENRLNAYFKQTSNFQVSRNMQPICKPNAEGYGAFGGHYDGAGYTISVVETININNSYGLFYALVGGVIENLGVSMDMRINNTADSKNVGMIASKISDNSTIKNCFAYGRVSVTGANVFGPLVGYASNSLIAESYVDVTISITDATGMIGGAVGLLASSSYVEAVYSTSMISVKESVLYSDLLPLDEVLAVGNIAGYTELVGESPAEKDNLYLENVLAVDGMPIDATPVANIADYTSLKMLQKSAVYFRNAIEPVLVAVDYPKTLGQLVDGRAMSKAAGLFVLGRGTLDSPFIMDTASKLELINRIPWAIYRQITDIVISGSIPSSYAKEIPFAGQYDGNHKSIANIKITEDTNKNIGFIGVLVGQVRNLKLVTSEISISTGLNEVRAGVLTGFALKGAIIENIIVSGHVEITSTNAEGTYILAGGVIGVIDSSSAKDIISLASVVINGPDYAIAGGVISQVQGTSVLNNLISISTSTISFEKQGTVGRVSANLMGTNISATGLHSIKENIYTNGRLAAGTAVSYANVSIIGDIVADYDLIAGDGSNIKIGGVKIKELLPGLYPFSGGNGTMQNPFRISTYPELLRIGDYMYANFVLTENIIIGDLNGDGELTATDKYKYNYKPIGAGIAFTGTLNGTSKKLVAGTLRNVTHSIIGLTDSLFEYNSGLVYNIGLTVDYSMYARSEDIPTSKKYEVDGELVTAAKVSNGNDVMYGAVAKINRDGHIRNVTVEGSIFIHLNGYGRAYVGGISGITYKGTCIANTVRVDMDIRGGILELGGIFGSVIGSDSSLSYMNTQIVEGEISAFGASISAGGLVGNVKVNIDASYATPLPPLDMVIYKNGEQAVPICYGYSRTA